MSHHYLKWSKIPITDRIKYLFRLENLMRENADELAKMVTIEQYHLESTPVSEKENSQESRLVGKM